MPSRRFTILAAVLVVLNLALWLAPQGLALRRALIGSLFGPRLIRAEVVVQPQVGTTPLDYLIDRGVITSASSSSLTIKEADGRVQTIPLAATTRVAGPLRFRSITALRPNLRVLVMRLGAGPATTIQVEGLASAQQQTHGGKRPGALP